MGGEMDSETLWTIIFVITANFVLVGAAVLSGMGL